MINIVIDLLKEKCCQKNLYAIDKNYREIHLTLEKTSSGLLFV